MTAQTILPANSVTGGFEVANSCRFNIGSSDHLTRSLGGSPTSTRKATWSYWVKKAKLVAAQMIYSNEVADDNNRGYIQFEDNDSFRMVDSVSSTQLKTNRLFRDVAAFYHIVLAIDTTQGTAANRIKLYVNGVQETSFATASYPSQNDDLKILTGGQTNKQHISKVHGGAGYFGGYLSEFVFIDGLQLAPTSFGEFDEDSGIWKPIDVSGLTFGTNGFYLDFENSGALGADVSGNSNNFTVNNLTAIDQSTDTCTNNFATLNPLDVNGIVLSEGNLNAGSAGATWRSTRGTFGMSSGKWYWEMKIIGGNTPIDAQIGVGSFELAIASNGEWSSANPSVAYSSGDGSKKVNGTSSSYGASFTTNDIIGVAFDVDNLNVTFYKNGASQGAITTGFSASDTFACEVAFYGRGGGTTNGSFNFGSPPYAISSGNTDGDGYGNFEYAVPSGYFSLNTKNLAEYG